MVGAHPRTACRKLFKKSEIFNIPKSIYVLNDEIYWKSGNISDHLLNT
jgi:hypothetical protein